MLLFSRLTEVREFCSAAGAVWGVPTCRGARGKGGILFSKRIPPLNPPEKDEGSPPSTPNIGSRALE